jgi:hypothetical protein
LGHVCRIKLFTKIFVEYHSSPDVDDRVGEEKLAEQRKKERHRSEVVQLHGRLADMIGSVCEWLLKDTICTIWHQRCGQNFWIAAQFKAIQPWEEAPKTEGKRKYDDDDFYHKRC